MIEILDNRKALNLLDGYFDHLTATGYVKERTTLRYLLYLFLYDFTDSVYDFITEEDYEMINNLLVNLFANGGCLLPYNLFNKYRTTVGEPRYMGIGGPRMTEDRSRYRQVEDGDNVRIV